jgi:quercetin dioxygenase-like cupin family protein
MSASRKAAEKNMKVKRVTKAETKPDVQDWGSLTWLAGSKVGNCDSMTVGRVVIKKGKSNPRHSHPNCDEVLYLLKGRLEHSFGADKILMDAGDTLVVPAGIMHNAVSIGSEDADMIVTYSSGTRQIEHER